MAAGYGFGQVLAMDPARRNRICIAIGCSAIGQLTDRNWLQDSAFNFASPFDPNVIVKHEHRERLTFELGKRSGMTN